MSTHDQGVRKVVISLSLNELRDLIVPCGDISSTSPLHNLLECGVVLHNCFYMITMILVRSLQIWTEPSRQLEKLGVSAAQELPR